MQQLTGFLAIAFIITKGILLSCAADISQDDLRTAILSLVNLVHDNIDKLERHELREKQLGEQIKKAFGSLDKRLKTQEGKMDLLVSNLAELTGKYDNLEKSIDSQASNQLNLKNSGYQTYVNIPETKTAEIKALGDKVDSLGAMINRLEDRISNEVAQSTAMLRNSTDYMIQEINKVASNPGQGGSDERALTEVQGKMDQMVNDAKFEIIKITEKSRLSVDDKIHGLETLYTNGQSELYKSLGDLTDITEHMFADIQKRYDQLSKEVKALVKVEQVLIQTADNVLDMKRRIEYGTHQILVEMGDLVRLSSKELNATLNYRFDNLTSSLAFNHNHTLTNLSIKVETEISQVWRQIGIMYTTLTASADVLNKVQDQTELYINQTETTLGGMDDKVGKITERMSEVSDDLNYLLGRLSLVTQEFNQIKTGLGVALDQMKSTFATIQNNNDPNPGPKPIPDLPESTDLSRTNYSTK
ncbi:uncharacterized protein [Bemisia tabaci]